MPVNCADDTVPREVAGGVGKRSIGHGQQRLARCQISEGRRAVGPHGDLQPVLRTGEKARTKIQRGREQAAGDRDSRVGEERADSYSGLICRIEREGKIIGAAGRAAADIEPSLIEERRPLGAGGAPLKLENEKHSAQDGKPTAFN